MSLVEALIEGGEARDQGAFGKNRFATRSDRLALRYPAFIRIAAAMIRMR